ncbi:MAG: CatA-like O-acetyltransferase [Thermoanaerobaculia bacterium]
MFVGYRVVDNYYRQEIFEFFRGYRNPFYSVSFGLKFSRLKAFLDERGWKTYLNLCYFFTRAMQPLEDFRYRIKDGDFVLYDSIHPGLTVPAAGGLFGFAYFDYDSDAARFNAGAVMPAPDDPPNFAEDGSSIYIYFTAIPGVPFDTFTHATDDTADPAVRVAFGKPYDDGGELRVPVGVQVNHAFVDGRALGQLYERAVDCFENPEVTEED